MWRWEDAVGDIDMLQNKEVDTDRVFKRLRLRPVETIDLEVDSRHWQGHNHHINSQNNDRIHLRRKRQKKPHLHLHLLQPQKQIRLQIKINDQIT